jgi:hypothetical protein
MAIQAAKKQDWAAPLVSVAMNATYRQEIEPTNFMHAD